MIWSCTDHAGHWVGVASVVVAASEAEARNLLDAALAAQGLKAGGYTLDPISEDEPRAYVLCNGDY